MKEQQELCKKLRDIEKVYLVYWGFMYSAYLLSG